MDVLDITEENGPSRLQANASRNITFKIEELREKMKALGRLLYTLDDIVHCLNHCR